jgi:hypothetical protein
MTKFDEMFKTEQKRIETKQQLANNEKQTKIDIVVDFCNEGLFEFLEYLHNKFYIRKYSVNHHVDGAVYERDIVYGFTDKESGIKRINQDSYQYFRTGIQHTWSNGAIFDTLIVYCDDYKPVLEYEGVKMDLDMFIETVITQIQEAINKNSEGFKIIEKY